MKSIWILGLVISGLVAGTLALVPAQDPAQGPSIPESLKAEHHALHEELAAVIALGGDTGASARRVADALHEHFAKEEEYALPPLGALAALAEGRQVAGADRIIQMANHLKEELPRMKAEHRKVVEALKALREAATKENKPGGVQFAEKLALHAQTEEEVLYPAAILVGEVLKNRQKK